MINLYFILALPNTLRMLWINNQQNFPIILTYRQCLVYTLTLVSPRTFGLAVHNRFRLQNRIYAGEWENFSIPTFHTVFYWRWDFSFMASLNRKFLRSLSLSLSRCSFSSSVRLVCSAAAHQVCECIKGIKNLSVQLYMNLMLKEEKKKTREILRVKMKSNGCGEGNIYRTG